MSVSRTRIKMCGMTRTVDIMHAVSLGVDAIGVIFYPESPRHVEIDKAKLLLKNVPAFIDVVAVCVNPEIAFVQQIITELPIQLLQFHGDETPEFCEQFNKPYIKAIPARSKESIVKAVEQYCGASAILLDTPSMVQRGGTGETFDWEIVPRSCAKPLIIAGGLTIENVNDVITVCSPYAVDVCSGVECSAGIKDHAKMHQFIRRVDERTRTS